MLKGLRPSRLTRNGFTALHLAVYKVHKFYILEPKMMGFGFCLIFQISDHGNMQGDENITLPDRVLATSLLGRYHQYIFTLLLSIFISFNSHKNPGNKLHYYLRVTWLASG